MKRTIAHFHFLKRIIVPSNMCLLSSNGVGTCYAPLFGEKSPSALCEDPESKVILGARTSLLTGMIRNVMNVTVIKQPTTQSDGWASLMMHNQSTLLGSGYTSTGDWYTLIYKCNV